MHKENEIYMNKKVIIAMLLIIISMVAQAQQIKVEYENKVNSLP